MRQLKTLYIVRHGKSSWDQPGVSDIDRPLKDRGIKNSYLIADFLKKKQLIPDIIYSSPAARAISTAMIFSRVLDFPEDKLFIKNDLYLADTSMIMDIVSETPSDVGSLMIFGHNPGFTDFVNYLSELKLFNLPTAGMAVLEFSSKSWSEISRSNLVSSFCEFPGES